MSRPPEAPSVLCVGAGIEQLPIIGLARRMGLDVLALDGNPDAVGLPAATRSGVVDLRDSAAVIQAATRHNTSCVLPAPLGARLTTVGAVNDALGLRGISLAAARTCTDKRAARERLSHAGLATPRFGTASHSIDVAALIDRTVGYPAILKPRYGSGSRGVVVVESPAALRRLLPWHLEQRGGDESSADTLIEEFTPGQEVGVDGVVVGHDYATLLIRDKTVTDLPYRLPYGFLTPTCLSPAQQSNVGAAVASAAAAMALSDCLVHADVIVRPDGQIVIVDLSGRPSGFAISTAMIPEAIGVDAIEQMIRLSLGRAASFHPGPARGVVLRMLSAPQGRLLSIAGLEHARTLPGVVAAETFLRPGEVIEERRTGASFAAGYVLTRAESRDEAEQRWQQAAAAIHFSMSPQVTP